MSLVLRIHQNSRVPSGDFIVIYRFPFIRACGIVNKLKKHFTYLAAAGAPSSVVLRVLDIINTDVMASFLLLGGTTCITLYALGIVSHKLVGAMYLSDDKSTVKMSYLDFWGKRVDDFCPVTDIVPLMDSGENMADFYIKVIRYSTEQRLNMTVRYGKVMDKELFLEVFGEDEK